MPFARYVRTFGCLLVLGLAGFGGGCGLGSQAPVDQQREAQIKASKKAAHQQIQQEAAKQQGASRKGARRGVPGR
jgi:hypothetical protein